MRRQFAAVLAVLGLVASACTSSADADPGLASTAGRSTVSTEEAQVSRLIENFFGALQQRNPYALYAMFSPDDECRPAQIADRLAGVTLGIAETSTVEVDDLALRKVGAAYSVTFTLIEHQGASENALAYDEFFPVEQTDRWRFSANLCDWLSSPADGDAAVREELGLALAALQAFYEEHGTYLASGNDLRYYASGLNATMDELALMPGEVLVVPGDLNALLAGQGAGGSWYCIAVGLEGGPVYGAGPTAEDVLLFESCADGATVGGW